MLAKWRRCGTRRCAPQTVLAYPAISLRFSAPSKGDSAPNEIQAIWFLKFKALISQMWHQTLSPSQRRATEKNNG
jgi:hypothetical protein